MLVEFNTANFRSFKAPVCFSMEAAKLSSKYKTLDETNVFAVTGSLRLLKTAAIYGANASGKSNLVKAIAFLRNFVLRSSKDSQATEPINVEPFRLSTEMEKLPSKFEVVFYAEGTKYRYGFEVDTTSVHREWLYYVPKIRETMLFNRDNKEYNISDGFREGKDLTAKTRDNALFLSVVAQFNGPISQKILNWFNNLMIISGLQDFEYRALTTRRIKDEIAKDRILKYIRSIDIDIHDLIALPLDAPPIRRATDGMSREDLFRLASDQFDLVSRLFHSGAITIMTSHKKYNECSEQIGYEHFNVDDQESEGTKKALFLGAPLLDSLNTGKVLIIDEFDSRLHPLVTSHIVSLFNSNDFNPLNAQLIFPTHDTNLLSNKLFRRDQIWFTEKDKYGSTALYSLAEYKVRNDASFEKDYISGRYGGIPFIGGLYRLAGVLDA